MTFKIHTFKFFCKDNCEWKSLKFKEAQTTSRKLEKGSLYERNKASETKKTTNGKLAKLETRKIQAINEKDLYIPCYIKQALNTLKHCSPY